MKPSSLFPGLVLGSLALAALGGVACRPRAVEVALPPPTRGFVLISLDALRPDHLGAHGYGRETSPFLDSLGARGVVFERAIAQYPSTLASHLSIFTGLYPQEHDVYKPEKVLSEKIETLPERLQANGFRTAGFTEGGFMAGGYGFRRGFDRFQAAPHRDDTDVEATFERGLEFLAELGDDERFFLFLHTYSIHDPYTPPEEYRRLFWSGEPPPGTFPSTGPNLRAANHGELEVTPEIVDYFVSQYDGSIRYVDDVLARFWRRLEELGLAGDTTLIVTSDHGEAFYEHGKLAHAQVYPEDLRVPLIVVHPALDRGLRVPWVVRLVDLAPTIFELAGVEPLEGMSGRSLAPYLADPQARLGNEGYGETLDLDSMATLFREQDGRLHQIILFEPRPDPDGPWVMGSVRFLASRRELDFEAQSFHVPRTVSVLSGDSEIGSFDLDTAWQRVRLELPAEAVGRQVTFTTPECASPLELGVGKDPRCLSFQVRGLRLRRTELYDLEDDPRAQHNLAHRDLDLHRQLLRRLASYDFTPVAAGHSRELSEETVETLRALGYIR